MHNEIVVRKWDFVRDGPLTEAGIRHAFPAAKYRVSAYRYGSGIRFDGATKRAVCHIVKGSVRYEFDAAGATLNEGDVAELPAGEYSFQVLGDHEVLLVLCWELPFAFNQVQ